MTGGEFVFVLPGRANAELERIKLLDVDRDWRFFEHGVAAWIAQSYLLLRDNGLAVDLSNRFQRNAINIAHASQLARRDRPSGCYVVATRADYPAISWCQFQIVQNRTQVSERALWLPHWPQPGLAPRAASRGDRVERVGYFGRPVNHYTRFFHRASGYFRVRDRMQTICGQLGLDLVERGPDCWNDFCDVDVVLGLRRFGDQTFDTKPPTKLINAWLAGAVFIGGRDSAYTQVGKHGHNYLLADSQAGCRKALQDLLSGAIEFRSLLAAGAVAASCYTRASICKRWAAALADIRASGHW